MLKQYGYLRYLFASIVAIAGLFAYASFAQAADVTASNDTTGCDSENQVEVDLSSQTDINIINNANIDNNINIQANTGGNTANGNTGDGFVETGDAEVSTEIINDVNRVSLEVDGGWEDSSIFAGNEWTGAFSENEVDVDIERELNVDVENDADINNDIDVEIETGDNEADNNCGDGEVVSGDALFEGEISTVANEVILDFRDGEGDIDLDLRNEETGCESENEIDVDIEDETDVCIDNDADIDNDIDIELDTGDNTANCNSDDGFVSSGDAEAILAIDNQVNCVDVALGDCGSIDATLANDTTGAWSDNEIDLEIDRENDICIDNDADIDNDICIEAETGDNEADSNCGDGEVVSGDIEVDLCIETTANVVELDLGDTGDICIDAANYQTGCDSENEIDIEIERNLNLCIENNLDVDNDICIDASTGDNEADCNNCDGVVESGDIDITGDIELIGNIVELSDFGDWEDSEVEAFNEITGCQSENEIDFEIDDEKDISINNCADIAKDLCLDIFTGCNETDCNNGDAFVESGEICVAFSEVETANQIITAEDFDDIQPDEEVPVEEEEIPAEEIPEEEQPEEEVPAEEMPEEEAPEAVLAAALPMGVGGLPEAGNNGLAAALILTLALATLLFTASAKRNGVGIK